MDEMIYICERCSARVTKGEYCCENELWSHLTTDQMIELKRLNKRLDIHLGTMDALLVPMRDIRDKMAAILDEDHDLWFTAIANGEVLDTPMHSILHIRDTFEEAWDEWTKDYGDPVDLKTTFPGAKDI